MGTHGIGQPYNGESCGHLTTTKSSAELTPVVVSGTGEGSWEKGMWDYKALPLPGAQIQEDDRLGASWSFEP